MIHFGTRLRQLGVRSAAGVGAIAIVLLAASPALAVYVDFADHIGAQSGNTAKIVDDGLALTVTSYPTNFDLSITGSGLGVKCTSGFWHCLGNSSSQIDAEWGEAVKISFDHGPQSIEFIDLSKIFRGEVAVIAVDDSLEKVHGTSFRAKDANKRIDLGGVVATSITVTTRGWFSDVAIRGLKVAAGKPVVPIDPKPNPANPVPEPSAALLFGAAFAVIGTARRRR